MEGCDRHQRQVKGVATAAEVVGLGCSAFRNSVKPSNARDKHQKTKFNASELLFNSLVLLIAVKVCVWHVYDACGGTCAPSDSVEVRG